VTRISGMALIVGRSSVNHFPLPRLFGWFQRRGAALAADAFMIWSRSLRIGIRTVLDETPLTDCYNLSMTDQPAKVLNDPHVFRETATLAGVQT